MEAITCPHCGITIVDPDALLCHHCGESLRRSTGGLLGQMKYGNSAVWVIVAVFVMVGFILLMVF